MSGIIEQIQNSNNELGNVTEDDFIDLMKALSCPPTNEKLTLIDKPLVFITGIGGLLNYMFRICGRRKLPRKMKKRIYLTKKLRKLHIPQYYKK